MIHLLTPLPDVLLAILSRGVSQTTCAVTALMRPNVDILYVGVAIPYLVIMKIPKPSLLLIQASTCIINLCGRERLELG